MVRKARACLKASSRSALYKLHRRYPDRAHRILIIDDEAAIRESLETLLMLEGYNVDTAPEGESGLDRTSTAQSYDLVLLDLALPGKNGLEVLPRIRERHPATAGHHDHRLRNGDNVVDAIRAGAQNFVQKPWDNEKLLADIRAAIARTAPKKKTSSSSAP